VVDQMMARYREDIDQMTHSPSVAAQAIEEEWEAGEGATPSRPEIISMQPPKPGRLKKRRPGPGQVSREWARKYLPEPAPDEDSSGYPIEREWEFNSPSVITDRMCAARIELGQDRRDLPPFKYKGVTYTAMPYEVCLNVKQAKRLFSSGTPVTKGYGCGTYACVWKKGDKDILKITHDAEDVAALLRTGNLKHVRRISKAYEVVGAGHELDTGESTPVFAIVSEDVEPIMGSDDPEVDKYESWIQGWWRSPDIFGFTAPPMVALRDHAERRLLFDKIPPSRYTIPPEGRAEFFETCEDQWGVAECKKFTKQYLDTWQKMARKGVIAWDMHQGNIGVSIGNRTQPGTWMIIDAGLSKTEPPSKRVQELREAWRAAYQKERRGQAWRRLAVLAAATAAVIALPHVVK
jgi:hypothetical protein